MTTPRPLIRDAHGWTQAHRRQLLHLIAAQTCLDQTGRDRVPWTWVETSEGVDLWRDGEAAFTITYAELAAGEAQIDAGRTP